MSPPPESETPFAEPARPTSLTVIGVIGIIFGCIGVLCVGGITTVNLIKGDPNLQFAPKSMLFANVAFTAAGVLLSLLIVIGSIGLVSLRPWSRPMMLVVFVMDLVFEVVKLPLLILWVLPMMMQLFQDHPPAGVQPQMIGFIRMSSIITWLVTFVITGGFDVFGLIVLNRPNVKAALAAPVMPESPSMM